MRRKLDIELTATTSRQKAAERDYLTLIPVDILEAIGAVTVNFAALEESVSQAIWYLLATRDEGVELYHQAITAELSFKQRVWMFAAVFRQRYSVNDQWITGATKRCFELEGRRNAVIHSIWQTWFPLREGQAVRLKTRARAEAVVTRRHDHTRDELAELAKSFKMLGSELESAALAAFMNGRTPNSI